MNDICDNNIPQDFDWEEYVKINKDLNFNNEIDAIKHYINHGAHEQRIYKIDYELIPADFDWIEYIEINRDLNFDNEIDAIKHYINHGIHEKRIYKIDYELIPPDFVWGEYVEINKDLNFNNETDTIKHYLEYGIGENRSYKQDEKVQLPTNFIWYNYLDLNPDLVINNKKDAINHYLNYGIIENRAYFKCVQEILYDTKYYIKNTNFVYPNVSVIIPNYNNSKYLLKRLESIYNQTIKPYEVIIIDDCSTDNSVSIINKYIADKIIPTKLIVNKKNTGSGYYNWIKGFEMATSDLIWIAESDDYCDNTFIETLIKEFIDKSVTISYCKTNFVNETGNTIWQLNQYLDDRWNANFKTTLSQLIKDKFSYLNIIPNVSSCIFKKPSNRILIEMNVHLKQNIKLVLDWIFYLLIAKNSSISYSNDVTNYYLVREKSVSKTIQKSHTYFKEHYYMMSFIIKNFNVDLNCVEMLYLNLKNHCNETKISANVLNSNYNKVSLNKLIQNNKQTILIFSYGFLLGGGEIFPIHLANSFYALGKNVIFMVVDSSEINKQIYKLLNRNIKIVNNISNIDKIINDFNITHVNTHHQCCDSIILNYCDNNPNKIKHFITDHGMYNMKSPDTQHLLNLIKKNNSTIVYINDNNLENFKDINVPKHKISISIDNYNNYTKINRKDYNIKDDDFVITLASRCIKEKGWEEMIDIMNLLNLEHKNVKLLLIGDYNNSFGTYLKNNCENKNIYFLGYKKNIKRFYEISDVGILPTYFECESNPIVMIECLYAKKPFIVTNIGETKNMLYGNNDYAGSLIELDNGKINKQDYVLELNKYIKDKNYYNSKINEIKHAVKKFYIRNIANNYIDIFNK
jgi:glycosyltransferase involved in cell wall biosynthesis